MALGPTAGERCLADVPTNVFRRIKGVGGA